MNKELVYFLSDIHLGLNVHEDSSREREIRLANWLEKTVLPTASSIYFVGDIFDYWFEFSSSEPIQYPHFFEALSKLTSSGVEVNFFTGNHDMWLKDYFTRTFGIAVFSEPKLICIHERVFYIAHGDGLGKGDYTYKMLKYIMKNKFSMFCYNLLPSEFGLKFMKWCSQISRKQHRSTFAGMQNERLISFAIDHRKSHNVDFYVMGHRHLVIDYTLPDTDCRFINLGDWLRYDSYAVFNGKSLELKSLKKTDIIH